MADSNRLDHRANNFVPRLIAYLLALYVALAPAAAFAFSPNDLGFDSLRNWGSLPGGGKGDYHFKTAAGEKYSKLGHSVTSSELGGVWRNRWVRGGLWGMAGVAAVAAALSAVDWILDPANNRIYMPDAPNYKYCVNNYVQPGLCYDTVNQFVEGRFAFASSGGKIINIEQPQYSESEMRAALKGKPVGSYKQNSAVFNYYYTSPYNNDTKRQSTALPYAVVIGTTNKEATDDDIAEAVERAEASQPGTKEALAKPDAEPAGAHGPTEKAKGGAQPDNPPNPDNCKSKGLAFDPAKNQCVKLGTNPNPTTDFPDFCTWASSLCDWLKWTKEEPLTPTASETTVDVKKRDETDFGLPGTVDSGRVRFSGQCPAPLHASFSLMGTGVNFDYSFDAVCDFATKLKPAVIGCAALSAAYIVMGQNRTRSE